MPVKMPEIPWYDIAPADATGITLPHPNIRGPLNENGDPCPWPWEPQQLLGIPLGQYHCGYCGAMVIAGIAHPDYRETITLDEIAHESEARWEILFPFVATIGDGGVYEPRAFTAGFNLALHYCEIQDHAPLVWRSSIRPEMVAQYDLLAMHLGYTATWEGEEDGWCAMTFTKAPAPW